MRSTRLQARKAAEQAKSPTNEETPPSPDGRQASPTPPPSEHSADSGQDDEPEPDAANSPPPRGGSRWLASQDRVLARIIKDIEPYLEPHGGVDAAWAKVAEQATSECTTGGHPRAISAQAAKARFEKLLSYERAAQTRAKQATGLGTSDSDISEHQVVMEYLLSSWSDRDENRRVSDTSAAAREKQDAEHRAGLEMRDASLHARVPAASLSDLGQATGSTAREQSAQRKRPRDSGDSDKENTPTDAPPRKRGRKSKEDLLRAALDERRAELEAQLKEARAQDDARHAVLVEQNNAMLRSMEATQRIMEEEAKARAEERALLLGIVAGRKI